MNFEQVYSEHANMLFRMCMLHLQNEQDARDTVQDTFLTYLEHADALKEPNHIKAWLIRVSLNKCNDLHRRHKKQQEVPIEELEKYTNSNEDIDILSEVMQLPEKLKTVIYLFYIEGYQVKEIADILHISVFSVKKRLQRGREQLRLSLAQQGGDIVCKNTNSLGQLIKLN